MVYRHICLECKKKTKKIVHTGMTSRTLYERAVNHEQDMRRRSDTSHAWTHVWDSHREIAELTDEKDLHRLFGWEVQKKCKTAFERTVSEAVLIEMSISSKDETLNSREEWGAYEVPELTIKERKRRMNMLDKDERGMMNEEGDE